jgi:hypothetical protein
MYGEEADDGGQAQYQDPVYNEVQPEYIAENTYDQNQ